MYDYIIIGSGFGGAASALRLAEKNYKVAIIEKGKWFKPEDFPKTNWNLKRWLWIPSLRWFGIQKLSFLRHITILSGIGVGGGSLVYANTLPIPKKDFYQSGSWSKLLDWEKELASHYSTALKMMGAIKNPYFGESDLLLKKLAQQYGKLDQFHAPNVAVYFGEAGTKVSDPYFNGKGPDKIGCIKCGACMTGCRHSAKNTLDTNYLHLAQQLGVEIIAENDVFDIIPVDGKHGKTGYKIKFKSSTKFFSKTVTFETKGVILSGGVMGTIPLLLKLKKSSLPNLSSQLGHQIRTNNEALIGNVTFDKSKDLTDGIAIGSILNWDEHTHIEPVRYGQGSGFWRVLMQPMISEPIFLKRFMKLLITPFLKFSNTIKMFSIKDFSKQSSIILFMQSLNTTIKFSKSCYGIRSHAKNNEKPTAFIPIAHKIARDYAQNMNGTNKVLVSETLTGIPTTAHILGGAVMGKNESLGVIDSNNKVFGYENMLICDGSMISANPGVNPSLSILAITERAMSQISSRTDI